MEYTLSCGHAYNRAILSKIAIRELNGYGKCPICKTCFTKKEDLYLSFCPAEKSLEEYFSEMQMKESERAQLELEVASKPKVLCSGICKNGNECKKYALKNGGIFCNIHK